MSDSPQGNEKELLAGAMPSLLDREITSAGEDAFGHRHFAQALEGLVESDVNQPPFSIGLLGKWGSGKSSIKSIYLESLHDSQERRRAVKPITFNAWRFGGEDIKRALLRHVFLELGGEELNLKDALYRNITKTTRESRGWGEIRKDLYERTLWSLPPLIVAVILVWLLFSVIGRQFGLGNDWPSFWISLALGGSATSIVAFLSKRLTVPRFANVTRIEQPMESAEEYEDLLRKQLKIFKRKTGRRVKRIVVFVDDLDRLSAEEMISGLDAVRAFMEISPADLPDDLGIVFVISVDEERVAHALANRRRNGAELPSTVFNLEDARRFLDRIFQFRLEIPQFPKQDLRSFALKRLREELPAIAADLDQRNVSLEILIDRMIHVGVKNPRNALQTLNAFVQSWWIAVRREREGAGTDRPGALHSGAVTQHPIALGALCALRVDFPDFFSKLQEEPDLIRRFTDVFIRDMRLEDQPESTQNILQGYVDRRSETDEFQLAPEHRPLRQYLSYLQGVRWPTTLQPLLTLSQDPVTRKFGDKAPRLLEAFVSGDLRGVLSELGRANDNKPLTVEDVRLLRNMEEELHHEIGSRRDSAAAVISSLAARLPDDYAHLLLVPLARRLADSAQLRWRLGIQRIGDVLFKVDRAEQQVLADRLVDDLLKPDGEIDFRLESGEPPSLDEAIEMVRKACPLVLRVRDEAGLLPQSDSRLLDWVESRHVASGDKVGELPFKDLQSWMADHESHLLPSLNERYTALLIAEMESSSNEAFDMAAAMRQSEVVFNRLWGRGEEGRALLWEQLSKYVGLPQKEPPALAWTFVGSNVDQVDAESLTVFTGDLARRLNKEMEDEEQWPLDWEAGAEALLALVESRGSDIGTEAHVALVTLIKSWSAVEDTVDSSVRLLTALRGLSTSASDEIIAHWTPLLLTDLQPQCVSWLAEQFVELDSTQRQGITRELGKIQVPGGVNNETAIRHRQFMDSLTVEGAKQEEIQNHLSTLFAQLDGASVNFNDDVFNQFQMVWPSASKMISVAPPPNTGTLLQNLFARIAGRPKWFGELFGQMRQFWPKRTEDLSPYDPDNLLDLAFDTANKQPALEATKDILMSAREMVLNNVASDRGAGKVVELAVALWPHHREEAMNTLLISQIPEPDSVATLMEPIDIDNAKDVSRLTQVWNYIAGQQTMDAAIMTATSILDKPANGPTAEPDTCLRLWLDAHQVKQGALLEALIIDDELNDEQRKRVWLQIERAAPGLGKDFLIEVIPNIAQLSGAQETWRAVYDSRDAVNQVFPQKDDRYDLAKSLLQAFERTDSIEVKNQSLQWIDEIEAEPVLRELQKPGVKLTDDDIQILHGQFPSSKHLKKVKATP